MSSLLRGVEGQQPQCRGQSPERQMAGALAQPVAVLLAGVICI